MKGFDFSDELIFQSETVLNLSDALKTKLSAKQVDKIVGNVADDLQIPVNGEQNLPLGDESIDSSLCLDSVGEEVSTDYQLRDSKYEYAVMTDISKHCGDFDRIRPRMAHIWPFELDPFQKHAISFLEDRQSVLVSAHTSAGKTVIAEYAIALALKHMTRVVYTSPVKALSNQKFRQFKQTFTDVGIITGDVQVNRSASCVVMTTEILRSMLFNGDRMVNNLEYVIFDEVHYISDSQRGVVWEEVLILLPNYVVVVLLSASVPNAMDFAEWVGSIKHRKVYVVETTSRPVPLKHFIYVPNANNAKSMIPLNTAKIGFNPDKFRFAMDQLKTSTIKHDWVHITKMVSTMKDTPMVVFCFSKKRIRMISKYLAGKISLVSAGEAHRIHIFINKSLERLQQCDRNLPQIHYMRDILKCGIGVHHSGILPIMKECVEMLFESGLVKVLFATDTFSMGVNMPAKTVFFEDIHKFEGTGVRMLKSGEYLQMAGRAGRRGMDLVGKVVINLQKNIPDEQSIKDLISGSICPLRSRFRLTYGTLLNLLKTGNMDVGDVIRLSFSDFGVRTCLVKLGSDIKSLEGNARNMKGAVGCKPCSVDIREFIDSFAILSSELGSLLSFSMQTQLVLVPGRVVIARTRNKNCVAVLLSVPFFKNLGVGYHIWCLALPAPTDKFPPVYNGCVEYLKGGPIPIYCSIPNESICWVGDHVMNLNYNQVIKNFKTKGSNGKEVQNVVEQLYQYAEQINFVLPFISKVGRSTPLKKKVQTIGKILTDLGKLTCTTCPHFGAHYKSMFKIIKNEKSLASLRGEYQKQEEALDTEYYSRLGVLKTLNYVSESGVVELKGNFARFLNHMELFLTELAVQGVFSLLDPADLVSAMSVLLYEGKTLMRSSLFSRNFDKALDKMKRIARKMDDLQGKHGVGDQYEYITPKLNDGLAEVAYNWALGLPFVDVMTMTDEDEGIVVRCIQRIHETLLDFHSACRSVGDFSLSTRVLEASRVVNRDIVFTGSLYVD